MAMNKIVLLGVGADPELFLKDKDGTPRSSEGIIGGSKKSPKAIPNLVEGFAVQEDNVAVEFNIPPATTAKDFSNHMAKALAYISKVAKARSLTLCYEAALHFPEDQLQTLHAQKLGCDPDFNVWLGEPNTIPVPPLTMRTAAGHVHVSWINPTSEQRAAMVKALDLYLTVPSILATLTPVQGTNRRSLYGRAGAARYKSYGVEARSLDNFWIAEPKNRLHVFNTVQQVATWLNNPNLDALEELEENSERIQAAINNHDRDLAVELMDYFSLSDFPVPVYA